MNCQTVTITINADASVPETFRSHTPDENQIMLLVGCHAVSIMKQNFVDLNVQEYKNASDDQYATMLHTKAIELASLKTYFDESIANEKHKRDELFDSRMKETNSKYEHELDVCRKAMGAFAEVKIGMMKQMQEQVDTERQSTQCSIMDLMEKLKASEKEVVTSRSLVSNMEQIMDLRISEEVLKKVDSFKDKLNIMEKEHLLYENVRVKEIQSELEVAKRKLADAIFANDQLKFEYLNKEYVNQTKLVQEMATLLETNKKTSSAGLGQEGENCFRELADETFTNYDNYELVDKRKIPHSGDFYLRFRAFTVMVDVKLFKRGTISTTDRNKLKRDMEENRDIAIAWMVSLEGGVANFNKHPFEIEIENGRLFVYINDLKNAKNPNELLKSAWYVSQFVYDNILMNESQATLLNKYKKYHVRIKDNLVKMLKLSKDRSDMMDKMIENHHESERIIKISINDEIVNIREVHQEAVELWWTTNCIVKDGTQLKTKIAYDRFIVTNSQHGITHEAFKMLLKNIVGEEYCLIGKTGKGQFTIQGHQLNQAT